MNLTYVQRRRKAEKRKGILMGIAGVGAVLALVVGGAVVSAGNEQTKTCTVTEKDRTRSGKDGSDMRVYTEECGTLGVGDVWLRGKFSSADTFGKIDEGKTYEFTTVGFRIPIASRFPTIIEVK